MQSVATYPVRVDGQLDPGLSRWRWLVKWLLAIPHLVVLVFLWLAFTVLSMVAMVAIVCTGRYPRGIFDFNLGVLRWTWRVCVLRVRRERHRPLPAVQPRPRGRLPGAPRHSLSAAPVARPRARQVVAARDSALPDRRAVPRRRRVRVALHGRRRRRRRPDRPAGVDRGPGAAVHGAVPARPVRPRAGPRPVGAARGRVRRADDRRLPALPPRRGAG